PPRPSPTVTPGPSHRWETRDRHLRLYDPSGYVTFILLFILLLIRNGTWGSKVSRHAQHPPSADLGRGASHREYRGGRARPAPVAFGGLTPARATGAGG